MVEPVFAVWIIVIIMAVTILVLLVDRRKLKKMSYKDEMTGLLNRNALNDFFRKWHKRNKDIAVLFLDLDHFKEINDKLGHHIGDLLIRAVGQRLLLFMSPSLRVFRIGGDEFLIIVERYDMQQAERLADQILYCIRNVYDIGGLDLRVSGTIGICLGTMKDDPVTLLRKSDTAMYQAKHAGKNHYFIYSNNLSETVN